MPGLSSDVLSGMRKYTYGFGESDPMGGIEGSTDATAQAVSSAPIGTLGTLGMLGLSAVTMNPISMVMNAYNLYQQLQNKQTISQQIISAVKGSDPAAASGNSGGESTGGDVGDPAGSVSVGDPDFGGVAGPGDADMGSGDVGSGDTGESAGSGEAGESGGDSGEGGEGGDSGGDGYAKGGLVSGATIAEIIGTDKIPAKLTHGEYIIPAYAVQAKGVDFFDKLLETTSPEYRMQQALEGN